MTTFDITPGHCGEVNIEEPPIYKAMSANAGSLKVIYGYVSTIDGSDWLNEAIKLAQDEMISDVDDLVREVKQEISKAKKLIPWHYKYFINPAKFWRQKLK